jgi:hypothetical protein
MLSIQVCVLTEFPGDVAVKVVAVWNCYIYKTSFIGGFDQNSTSGILLWTVLPVIMDLSKYRVQLEFSNADFGSYLLYGVGGRSKVHT